MNKRKVSLEVFFSICYYGFRINFEPQIIALGLKVEEVSSQLLNYLPNLLLKMVIFHVIF